MPPILVTVNTITVFGVMQISNLVNILSIKLNVQVVVTSLGLTTLLIYSL